jgi:energy-coupling factor transporter ATP-binding protein EcfA2
MTLSLNPDQLRILNWRVGSGGIAGIVGPPGCGKTTTGSALALKLILENKASRVLLVAYTNSAANEFGRELCNILTPNESRFFCVRSGYPAGADPSLSIPFSNNIEEIRSKKIVICTTLSLRRVSRSIRFDNMIVDEAGVEKLQDLLAPFTLGINQRSAIHLLKNKISYEINNIIELASSYGIVATVVGDPKQSRPIGLSDFDQSAMEYVLKHSKSDTLFTTHRLPDTLSSLVNEFANYNGLKSASDIASRRLNLNVSNISPEFKNVILPDDVVTWIDVNGIEEMSGPSSWYNEKEAIICSKLCNELSKIAPNKSIVVVTRYTEQRRIISNYLRKLGLTNIRVLTTTGALGTQADIVLFSIVRNNPERQIGAMGSLQDLNVAISRSKEKLFIIGSFDMMLNGWSKVPTFVEKGRKSISRRLACLVANKYGQIIQVSSILQ